jgi:hypothetical protein
MNGAPMGCLNNIQAEKWLYCGSFADDNNGIGDDARLQDNGQGSLDRTKLRH